MKPISVRNVPDHVYSALRAMARTNRRSLQEQIRFILEQEVKLSNRSFSASEAQWRRRLQDRELSDAVDLVRADRDR